MILYADTKRQANRIARAIATMTGYQPTVFGQDGRYRVQENNFGTDWQEALESLLAQDIKADDCTLERVEEEMKRLEIR